MKNKLKLFFNMKWETCASVDNKVNICNAGIKCIGAVLFLYNVISIKNSEKNKTKQTKTNKKKKKS